MTCDHQTQGAAVLKQTFPTARVHWKWKPNLCSLYEKLHGSSVQLNWNQKNRESKTLKPGLAHHIRINEVLFQRNTVGSENGKSEIQNLIWNKGFLNITKSHCVVVLNELLDMILCCFSRSLSKYGIMLTLKKNNSSIPSLQGWVLWRSNSKHRKI